MKVIGIREIKNRLSEYIRLVAAGEEVLITDRGEVVAELKRPDSRTYADMPVGLISMVREGRISYSGKNNASLYPTTKRLTLRESSANLLSEERKDH
jgi:antitoxin (DNA-binding transcriptional repressor) of toxin-antitoxin stability system